MKNKVPATLAAIGLATMLAVSATTGVAFADDATADPTATAEAPQAEPAPAAEPVPAVEPAPEPAPAIGTEAEPEPTAISAPAAASSEAPAQAEALASPVVSASPATAPTTAEAAVDPADDETYGEFTLISPGPDSIVASGSTIIADFGCADPESGIVFCELRDHHGDVVTPGQRVVLADGTYVWFGEVTNGAGLGTRKVFSFVVGDDTEAPTITTDYVEPASGWVGAGYIRFTASDDVAGVKEISIRRDGITTLRVPVSSYNYSSEPGEHVLEYWATDRVGKESEHHTIVVRSDKVKPEIDLLPFGTTNADGDIEVKLGSDEKLDFECSDALSGIDFCGVPALMSQTLDTDDLGEHSINLQARDLAQNVQTLEVSYIVVEEFSEPTNPGPTDPDPTDPDPTTPEVPAGPAAPPVQQPSTPVRGAAATAQNVPDRLAYTGADSTVGLGFAALLLAAGGSVLALRQYRRQRG